MIKSFLSPFWNGVIWGVQMFFGLLIAALLVFGPHVAVLGTSLAAFMWVTTNVSGNLGLFLAMLVAGLSAMATEMLLSYSFGHLDEDSRLNDNSPFSRWFWNLVYWVIKILNWISKFMPVTFGALIVIAYFTQIHWVIVAAAIALWLWVGNSLWNK